MTSTRLQSVAPVMHTDNVQDPAPASPCILALVASSATTHATTSTTIATQAKHSHKKASNTASLNGVSCAAGGI